MVVGAHSDQGPIQFTIKEINEGIVTADFNHQMAGMTLRFNVEVIEVRPASEEELAHGDGTAYLDEAAARETAAAIADAELEEDDDQLDIEALLEVEDPEAAPAGGASGDGYSETEDDDEEDLEMAPPAARAAVRVHESPFAERLKPAPDLSGQLVFGAHSLTSSCARQAVFTR